MTRPDDGMGRLVRGGRVVARVLVVWAVSVLALRLLDAALDGFSMPFFWQPTVVALAFAVLSAVIWPLLLRVALPVAVVTLGIGSFLLLGAALLGLSFLIPDIVITDLGTAVVVAVVMSGVAALVSSVLGLDEDELFFRRTARRRPDGSGGDAERPPGVIVLQVDGLGFDTVRRAVRDGDMPTFARWLTQGTHALTDWHCDWSSQTGASVCGILHGSNDDILGFRWYEKDRDHVMACAHPEDAAEIERRHSDGAGLLAVDGAGHGNLFTGDAAHVSLTMSAVPLLAGRGRRGRKAPFAAGYYAYFANPFNAVRTLGSSVADIVREVSAATRQRRADVRPRIRRGGFYPFARAATNVIARDVVVSAIIGDMLDGRSVVYADFLGYDEVAHHSGIERFDSLAVLREIDQQIGRLHRATQLAPRPYHLVALSDHGQTQGHAFVDRFGESVEQLVGRLCGPQRPPLSGGRSAVGEAGGSVAGGVAPGGKAAVARSAVGLFSRGLSSAGPSVGGPSTVGPSSAGPSSAGPAVAGPAVAGPAVGGPSSGGPSARGPSSGGPSVGGPSARGPSSGGLSAGGPSAGGPSAGGPSAGGPSAGGPSAVSRAPRRSVEGWQVGAGLAEASLGDGPMARRLRARVARAGAGDARARTPDGTPAIVTRAAPGVVVVASGHVAMVSFTEHAGRVPLETIEREHPDLLPALVDHAGVGFVLVRSAERGPLVLARDGLLTVATGEIVGEDPLAVYGPHAPELVHRVDGFAHCPDLMINSRYDPATDDASPFEPHVGSHGGLGGVQSRGFLLYPAGFPAPGEIVGAEALHRVLRGWLTHLGQPSPPVASSAEVAEAAT